MSEPKYNLLKDIEIILRKSTSNNEQFEEMLKQISIRLNNYDVASRCFELALYTDENQQLINRYCACLLIEGKSAKTIEAYQFRIKHMFETLEINLKDINPYDIRFYLAIMKENGCSNHTLETIRSYIHAFYKWMVVEEFISRNPCTAVTPIKYTKEIKEAFSELDLEKIRSNCKNIKERALVEILLSSGIRVSELEQMNTCDLNFQEGSIHVKHGKGNKERITYMSPVAAHYITKYLATRKDNAIELFHTRKGRLQTGGIRYILKRIGARAGVDHVHPHRFRRTFATILSRKGMAIQDIQYLMGHDCLDTTMIYININKKAIRSEYMKYMQV